jgi:TctA family transporter
VLASGSLLHAIAMVVVGLVLGLIGTDVNSGIARYTLGFPQLSDGVGFVVIAMGMFGLAEIVANLSHEETRTATTTRVKGMLPSREDWRRIFGPIMRGTALGSVLGILPGGGALLASFASYSLEKKLSSTPERFGQGAIEGVAGPESENNAGAQTSFIPMLTLGIPGNPTMAMMIGALMVHGIAPGPRVMTDRHGLFWGLIASMWIGNLMLVILNLPLVGLWARLLQVPYRLLFPSIIAFCCIGAYTINSKPFDLYVMAFFAIFGYLAIKLDCEPAPLILGFVLGPMMEENLRRALLISRGDPLVFVQEPISLTFLLVAVGLLAVVAAPVIRRTRETALKE